jgi:DNA replication protein DnaC
MEHSSEFVKPSLQAVREPLGEKQEQCAKHGAFTSTGMRYAIGPLDRRVWTTCPACEEERLAAERQAAAEKAARAEQARLEEMLDAAAIPPRFIGRTFDSFKASTPAQQRAVQILRAYAEEFEAKLKTGASLILLGGPGTGKSHLAGAVLQAIMPRHCGLYTTAMGIIRAVRATWRRDSERSEGQVLTMLADVPLLVIDEIGVQYGTDGEQTILFEVLDRRYREMRPTILLANQSKEGLKQFLGDRTYDRLTETARIVLFEWDSYRPQARRDAA